MESFRGFILMIENRVEFLKKNTKELDTSHDEFGEHKKPEDIIDHFATHGDPSEKKVHTQWIIGQYKKKNVRQEDTGRIHDTLTSFDRYKGRLPPEQRDINRYGHIGDVESALQPHLGGAASNKEEKRAVKSEGADLVHDQDGISVHRLKTHAAACQYGAGTKWCTTQKSSGMFDTYHKQGPLYVVQNKNETDPVSGGPMKHQLHFETGQYAQSDDRNVGIDTFFSKHPSLTKVGEFQNKHPIFDSPESFNKKVSAGHVYPGAKDPIGWDAGQKKPLLTSDTLSKATERGDRNNMMSIIKHPNTSPDILEKTLDNSSDRDSEVKNTIASNPGINDSTVSKIISGHPSAHGKLAGNPRLNTYQVKSLDSANSASTSPASSAIRETLASHPNAPTDLLHHYLVDHNNTLLSQKVLLNKNTSPDTFSAALEKPALHPAIAVSPSTPTALLHQLKGSTKHDFIKKSIDANLKKRGA